MWIPMDFHEKLLTPDKMSCQKKDLHVIPWIFYIVNVCGKAWKALLLSIHCQTLKLCLPFELHQNLMLVFAVHRADFRFAPSQWEAVLLCNDVSRWLGASLESTLSTYSVLCYGDHLARDSLYFAASKRSVLQIWRYWKNEHHQKVSFITLVSSSQTMEYPDPFLPPNYIIQLRAVITMFSITWCCVWHDNGWGKTKIWGETQKRYSLACIHVRVICIHVRVYCGELGQNLPC